MKSKPASKNKGDASATVPVNITPPAVRVKLPEVNVDLGDPQVNVDMGALVKVVEGLAQQVVVLGQTLAQGMAAHDKRLIDITNKQNAILEKLADQKTPIVKMGDNRPRSFDVSVVKDDGTEYRMQVAANREH